MKTNKNPKSNDGEQPSDDTLWKFYKRHPKLVCYKPSGTIYARFRLHGKLIWKSLKTDKVTYAEERLSGLIAEERKRAERGQVLNRGKMLFKDAMTEYTAKGFRPVVARTKKDARALKPAAMAYYEQRLAALVKSWPELPNTPISKITEHQCQQWAERVRGTMSGTAFNHTLGMFRNILDFGVHAGARYGNPAKAVVRESETSELPTLPSAEQFNAFVTEIENGGGGFSQDCAELVRFMAFGGLRKGEAAYVTWADCDFVKNQITVRGHPETGLKNRQPGEVRYVPMIPDMIALLQRLKAERPEAKPEDVVMRVRECQKAMDRAAKKIGMERITHHDLRHLWATRCIESGVDVPTVSRWLGHRDGGALAMRIYAHLRDQHSAEQAARVTFTAPDDQKIIPIPQAKTA